MRAGRTALMATLFGIAAATAQAQTGTTDTAGQPMSAIDWLSRSVEQPQVVLPVGTPLAVPPIGVPAVRGVTVPQIEIRPLSGPSADRVGLLPSSLTGLPAGIWAASDEVTLIELIGRERSESIPALQELLITLLLAEADPPLGAGPSAQLFLARIDKLLELGALDPARSLLLAADPASPALFQRWFDVALLTGTESEACEVMRDSPGLAPTYPARIFCLARSGDWDAASIVLFTGRALGDVDDETFDLLDRFLDPETFDGADPLPPPQRVSPLVFRLREAIGERLTTGQLPRAFAHADLSDIAGWRNQMEAAERLSRAGAVSGSTLQALYTARMPAASGGVWDRASAFQRFDVAVKSGDPVAVSNALPGVWAAMEEARIEVSFADLYREDLARLPLVGDGARLSLTIRLLSRDYEAAGALLPQSDPRDALLSGVAQGRLTGPVPRGIREQAVAAGFGSAPVPPEITALLTGGKLGEALLQTIMLFDEGLTGDPARITDALAALRAVGLEDIARRAALQYLLLDRDS